MHINRVFLYNNNNNKKSKKNKKNERNSIIKEKNKMLSLWKNFLLFRQKN